MKHDREAFTTEYTSVMITGDFTSADAMDAYAAALGEEPVEERLKSLRDFMRRKIDENLPLNWFTGEPLREIEEARRMQVHVIDLANGVIGGNVEISAVPGALDLGLSDGQYKRLLRDCLYESFITMTKCGLNIENLTMKDVDRAEFTIIKGPNGRFDVEPMFIFFGGDTQLHFDKIGIVYNDGVVPEYEGDENGESAVYPAE